MKTLALTDLQIAFHDYLLNQPSMIAQQVMAGGRISVEQRLHVYHHAYRTRLLENLRDAYEKTWAYLGDTAFESSALAYIEKNPPQHRNLRWHGADFPQWLAHQFSQDMDIAELALIDWQLRYAFDGPNADPIQPAALAKLSVADWENVGFCFAPTLFIAPLCFNTVSIWHALDQTQAPPVAKPLTESCWLLIWRKGWQPHFRTIQAVEHSALLQLMGGASFAQVCVALGQQFSDEKAAIVAADGLRNWLRDELIVGLTGCS